MSRGAATALVLAAALALGACAGPPPQREPASAGPTAGAVSSDPSPTSGLTNSPQSGSTSNAASGSSVLQQEGPASGTPGLVP